MEFLEILKYVLPSLVVLACTYLIIKQFFNRDQQKDRLELMISNSKVTLPVRLAAYERLALFLERINPNNLVVRVSEANMTAFELQRALLITIRAEYEHNMSQQIYISSNSWKAICDIKELIVQIVNKSAQTVKPDAKASELGAQIITIYGEQNPDPIAMAVNVLKSEVTTIF